MAKDAQWAAIMQRRLFAEASDEGSGSLGHLTALYVERHHSLWKVLASRLLVQHALSHAKSHLHGAMLLCCADCHELGC